MSTAFQLAPADLATRLKSEKPPRLLDVREPEEFGFVHLPHARLIPLGELPFRTEELTDWREEEIVVYCHHGVRSQRAIDFLREAGFTKLENLAGGIDAWSLEVDPATRRY